MARSNLLSLFGCLAAPFLVPAKTASAVARSRGQGRPVGRRALRAFLDEDEHGGMLVDDRATAWTSRALRAAVVASSLALCIGLAVPGNAQARRDGLDPSRFGADIEQASRRSGLPQPLIRAVAWVESGGSLRAQSPKGAMGLMQVMPATWRELRADLGLGNDPFDQGDNLIAGAVYLRRMLDRFGVEGFLAAYNAGPGRYQEVLDGKRSLPAETVAYVARVHLRIDHPRAPKRIEGRTGEQDWRASGLFVDLDHTLPKSRLSVAESRLFAGASLEIGP